MVRFDFMDVSSYDGINKQTRGGNHEYRRSVHSGVGKWCFMHVAGCIACDHVAVS